MFKPDWEEVFRRSDSSEMATISRTRVQDGSTVESPEPESGRVVLKLKKPAKKRHVAWTAGTVDNEDLNRRKSKCCCVYVKPHEFGESSSDSEADECEHCSGHVERRRQRVPASASTVVATEDCVDTGDGARPEPRRHVAWAADTIDNENMNKRKSKCCCIFEKRRDFGESSSDSEADDCANCRGHKERPYKNAKACEPMLPNPFSVHGDAS